MPFRSFGDPYLLQLLRRAVARYPLLTVSICILISLVLARAAISLASRSAFARLFQSSDDRAHHGAISTWEINASTDGASSVIFSHALRIRSIKDETENGICLTTPLHFMLDGIEQNIITHLLTLNKDGEPLYNASRTGTRRIHRSKENEVCFAEEGTPLDSARWYTFEGSYRLENVIVTSSQGRRLFFWQVLPVLSTQVDQVTARFALPTNIHQSEIEKSAAYLVTNPQKNFDQSIDIAKEHATYEMLPKEQLRIEKATLDGHLTITVRTKTPLVKDSTLAVEIQWFSGVS